MAIVEVPSEKDEGAVYTVDTDTGVCSCQHYQRRLKLWNDEHGAEEQRRCKHFDAAISIEYPSTDAV